MDLGSECSVDESAEVNEEIASATSESKTQNNGNHAVEKNNDKNELNQKEADESVHAELKREASSPLSTPTRKGYGLKKWRRIKRDVTRDGGSSIHTAEIAAASDLQETGANRSKRVQYDERKLKSEDSGSVSSTKAAVRNFDGFPPLNDSSLGLSLSQSFAAGTDSENSEDRSSKSSTAASAPKMKYDKPLVAGFPRDKSKIASLNGKHLQFGKKARGGRVKIEKENSHSSVESDSRSSNFGFMQGNFTVNNGVVNEGTSQYNGENGKQVNDGDKDGGEDAAADSSWAHRHERSNNHGPLRDNDQLAESIKALQSAQEALEQEVIKFKEIGNDISPDGSISDLITEHIDVETTDHPKNTSRTSQSEVVETGFKELEEIFKRKIEAEVEYLAISRTIQKLRIDQTTALKDYKSLLSEQRDTENKAAVLKKEAEKVEKIANAEELLKLQKRVGKYGLCLALQILVFFVLFFVLRFSQDYVDVVPT